MLVYLLIFFFAIILFFQPDGKKDLALFYVFGFFYVMVSGCRDMIGGFDVYVYGEVYESPLVGFFLYEQFEKGFLVYYGLLKQISDDRYFMFFMTALIMALLHFRAIKLNSPLVYFSAFLFFCKFFLLSFIYLRQGLAMGIIWLSIPYIKEKKYIYYFFFVMIAFFFHKSSIIFMPFFFFAHYQFKSNQLFLLTISLTLLAVSPFGITLSLFFSEQLDNEKFALYATDSSAVNFQYLFEVVMLTLLLTSFRNQFYRSKTGTIVYNGLIGYTLVTIVGLTNASFVRFSWYYFIFVALALPQMYLYIKEEKSKSLFKVLVLSYFTIVFFNFLLNFDFGDLMPYKSIFQDFSRGGKFEFMEYRTK